jgi:hypothetical protein
MYQTVEGEAYLLDMAVEAYDVWTDKLKKKQEELAKATTEAQKRVIQAEIKAIEEEQRKAEVSYQETAKKLLSNDKYFKKDTREFDGLSYMFRDILTDENGKLQGVELDSQGNFISADVTKARRLAEVMGFKPGTTSYGYYNGRRTKRYGIIVKEEVASVQGKRTGEDSIFEIVNTPFEWEAIAKIITGLTGGLTEKQIRKTSAEVANIFKGLSINNAQWTPRHLWLTNEVEAKFGKELTAIGNKVRENMALKTTAAIERFANVSAEMTKVKKNVLAKFDQQIKQAADEENARRTAQGLEALKGKPLDHWTEEYVINNLATTQAYQRELIKETKEHISVNYGIKNSEVEHIYNDDNVVQFEYNQKTGRVEARVNAEAANATDAEERTKFLAVINSAIINGNSRGSEGEAKNSFSGKNDDLIPSIKREMGKNQEEFYQHERVSKVLQEAIKAEVSKMLAEEGPESELRRLGYIK